MPEQAQDEHSKMVREREVRRRERLKEMTRVSQIQRVKVIPATDEIRKYVKHPTGIKFGKSGPAEWPMDGFTRKRIREGAVKLEGEPAKAAAEKRAPRAS